MGGIAEGTRQSATQRATPQNYPESCPGADASWTRADSTVNRGGILVCIARRPACIPGCLFCRLLSLPWLGRGFLGLSRLWQSRWRSNIGAATSRGHFARAPAPRDYIFGFLYGMPVRAESIKTNSIMVAAQ